MLSIIVIMRLRIGAPIACKAERSENMSNRMMTAFVEYRESSIENGTAAEKKLLDRRVLCAGIVVGLLAAFFAFGWVMGNIG